MSRWRPIATTIIAVLGLGVSGYLTWGHYFDQASINNPCPLGKTTTAICCGCVTTSAQSMIFGLPVALYGLLYFVAMIAICLPVAWRSPSMWIARLRLVGAVAGMGMVLYLISMEAFVIHHVCIYCSVVHLLQFVLFLLIVTGWQDTGWAASYWDDDLEEGSEDYEETEPEPVVEVPIGGRPPRGKARRQASTVRT